MLVFSVPSSFLYLLASLFISECACSGDSLHTIRERTKLLHRLTPFSTFYDFFGLRENANARQVKLAFRKMRKAATPPGMNKEQYNMLVGSGYSFLTDHKDDYDTVLRNSTIFYLDEDRNYRNYFGLVFLALIVGLVFLDVLVCSIRYIRYYEELSARKKNKKSKKDKQQDGFDEKKVINPPTMVLIKMYYIAKGIFIRK